MLQIKKWLQESPPILPNQRGQIQIPNYKTNNLTLKFNN